MHNIHITGKENSDSLKTIADKMTCPKCGFERQEHMECRKCGIVFAKYSAGLHSTVWWTS